MKKTTTILHLKIHVLIFKLISGVFRLTQGSHLPRFHLPRLEWTVILSFLGRISFAFCCFQLLRGLFCIHPHCTKRPTHCLNHFPSSYSGQIHCLALSQSHFFLLTPPYSAVSAFILIINSSPVPFLSLTLLWSTEPHPCPSPLLVSLVMLFPELLVACTQPFGPNFHFLKWFMASSI